MKGFYRFLPVFLILFTSNIIESALFKPEIDVSHAFSVAFGFSLGLVIVDYFVGKKLLFIGIWAGITLPILLSMVFALLKPIVNADHSGISMLFIALLVGILDFYIGMKIFDKKIQTWLDKRKN